MKTKLFAAALVVVMLSSAPLAYAKSKSHWAMGMGIGAGVGATAGALVGYFGGSCKGSSEPSDCDAMAPVLSAGLGVLGLLVGGGIGAGIGAAIPKKANVVVSPVLTGSRSGINGGGIGVQGSF